MRTTPAGAAAAHLVGITMHKGLVPAALPHHEKGSQHGYRVRRHPYIRAEKTMSVSNCERCGVRPATLLGVPAAAAIREQPDGTPLLNSSAWRYDASTVLLRICEPCTRELMTTHEIIAAYDLATWRDPLAPR
jgi:hypothetical protein